MTADLFGEGKEQAMTEKKGSRREPDAGGTSDAAAALPGDPRSQPAPARLTPAGGPAAADAPGAPPAGLRFEDASARLEQLVSEMERGDLPLEELLTRFEEGVKLVRHCQAFLKQAQQRVSRFVEQKDGHWVLKEQDGE